MKRNILKTILILVVILITKIGFSQDSIPQLNINTSKDTIIVIHQNSNDEIIKEYQNILEKTNAQLNMWTNPYGILISILGVFIALLAVIVAFVLFKQNKSNKQLIEDSVGKYEEKLEQIDSENQLRTKNYEERLNNLIQEYSHKLKSEDEAGKKEIQDFIVKLKDQIQTIDSNLHIHKHSGWRQKDITVSLNINSNSIFYTKITLDKIGQTFVIYFRVLTNDNKRYWFGFSGNRENEIAKSKYEYTQSKLYPAKEVIISENILEIFNKGFPELNTKPVLADTIRLRGSDSDTKDIYFEFKIMGNNLK